MKILKKTHKKKLEIENPISFSIDEIIGSLEPGTIFIINDLFFYTIKEDFSEIDFYLIINDKCVSAIFFDVKKDELKFVYTKEIYRDLIKANFDKNKIELANLKNLICM